MNKSNMPNQSTLATNTPKRIKLNNRKTNILKLKSKHRFSTDEIYEKFHKFGKICGLYDNQRELLIVYLIPKEAEEAHKHFKDERQFSLEFFYF